MEVYKENIHQIRRFLKSDYYQDLQENDEKLILTVMDAITRDPDSSDKNLYLQLGKKYRLGVNKYHLRSEINNEAIKLSADAVCGWKQLYHCFGGTDVDWLSFYAEFRGNLNLHFIWPQHKLPTINTTRYIIYKDRIDYCLYDLKQYFNGVATPMLNVYQQDLTAKWLSQFNWNFNYFIDQMQLRFLVNDTGEVLDISRGQQFIVDADFAELKRHVRNEKIMRQYFKELFLLSKAHHQSVVQENI